MSEREAVTVRQATTSDRAAVEAVVYEAFNPYIARIGIKPVPMEADYAALIDAGNVWVATCGDENACGVLVLVAETDHLMLETIAVCDAARGIGVGARLMAYAEEHARALGLPAVHLYTNEVMWENLEYYPKLGYVEQGRATVGGIYHRVFFTKPV